MASLRKGADYFLENINNKNLSSSEIKNLFGKDITSSEIKEVKSNFKGI
ncbi:MAG: hypothetical protein Q9M97_03890 [Candidatus Gracilibacteria bacterium]|nr:hypothetical protein [Candidatus Gracilibacteria bacterium]